jgi:hypothetical protein
MSSNKRAKQELIRRYGAECFIEKLQLRKEPKKRYTGQGQMKRMKQLTYHHIKMKKDGGRATVENGALLSAENHSWFHQQSPQMQGYMNAIFQEYKRQSDECVIEFVDHLDLGFTVQATTFMVPDKEVKKEKYDRAKTKEEFRKRIREDLDERD